MSISKEKKKRKSIWLFTNYASQCQGHRRDIAGTNRDKAGRSRDKAWTNREKQGPTGTFPFCPCLSLHVPVCPCLSHLVPACPGLSLSDPVCPCLSLSVPVCLYICYTFMSRKNPKLSCFSSLVASQSMNMVRLTFLAKVTVQIFTLLPSIRTVLL